MSEDSEEAATEGVQRDTAVADDGQSVDTAAESFLAVESRLRAGEGQRVRGQAVGVTVVPAESVPADYPVPVETPDALALELELDGQSGETATAYFAFDDSVADNRLARLLAVHDIPADRFADLHGELLLLTVDDGHVLPVVPPAAPRGDRRGIYGVVAGLGVNVLVLALAVTGLGSVLSLPAVVAWLFVTSVGLPAATYLDAWHLRTHTDWGQGPAFWAALAVLPGISVVTTLAYLWTRQRAEPLADGSH